MTNRANWWNGIRLSTHSTHSTLNPVSPIVKEETSLLYQNQGAKGAKGAKSEPTAAAPPAKPPVAACLNCQSYARKAFTCGKLACYAEPNLEPACGGKYFQPLEVQP